MKISIALATYNGAKYLPDQLQSIMDQTRHPDELVVSDDSSSDNTLEIIKDFARTAPFEVRWSRNEQNLGYAGNFNVALMQTTGDLVFLCDQDDVWFSEKVARLEALAEKHPEQLVIMNDAALTDAELNEVGLTKLNQIRSAGFSETSFVMGCCCAIRRRLLDLCLPIPSGFESHDYWIVNFSDCLGAKLISEQVLQFYRRHGANESQFISNRTSKVTRWEYLKEALSMLYRPVLEDYMPAKIQQKRLQIEGIQRALKRDKGRYARQLRLMDSEAGAALLMMEKRMEIRRKSFPARLVASLRYWLAGGYGHANGLNSVVRDVVWIKVKNKDTFGDNPN